MTDDFKRGAKAAADMASSYDASSTHAYRLGDCILSKLNLRAGKPRRNKARVETPDAANLRGFALALAEVSRLLICAGHDAGLCHVAANGGLTIATAKAAGVDPYDLKELRKAGVR